MVMYRAGGRHGDVSGPFVEPAVAVTAGELDESAITPMAAPAVLCEHEGRCVSDRRNRVVDLSVARGIPDYMSIVLEELVGHFEGDRHRSTLESSYVCCLI